MTTSSEQLSELGLDLTWSLWTELGVPGVDPRHEEWSVDLEPLMVFTARWSERDPRLRDESLRWCVGNRRLISRARLRALLKLASDEARSRFGRYAATIAAYSGGNWPGATESWPLDTAPYRRYPRLDRPSVVRLRLRALFGVSARAEILHAFIARPDTSFSASDLAQLTAFTKANVHQELESFSSAGLLSKTTRTNQSFYALGESKRLLDFVGQRPLHFIDWAATLRWVDAILDFITATDAISPLASSVETAELLSRHAPDRERAGFPERPPDATGEGLVVWFEDAAVDFLRSLALGEMPKRSRHHPAEFT